MAAPYRLTFRPTHKSVESTEAAKPILMLHGVFNCPECDFPTKISTPVNRWVHGYCPRCGAEHEIRSAA